MPFIMTGFFFQNVTVGRIGGDIPEIGNNVILYPGSIVSGRSKIGNRCVISAGAIVGNMIIPDDSIVFGAGASITVKPRTKN